MRIDTSVLIAADRQRVWQIVADVENWPLWTPSMSTVEILDGSALAPGVTVRIKQPKLPVTKWTVTDWREGDGFMWQAVSLGMRSAATHDLHDDVAGTRLRLIFTQTGPLAGLSGLLLARLSRCYVEAEAYGLKRESESGRRRQQPPGGPR